MKVLVEFDLKNEKQKELYEHVCRIMALAEEEDQDNVLDPLDINVALTGRKYHTDTRQIIEEG